MTISLALNSLSISLTLLNGDMGPRLFQKVPLTSDLPDEVKPFLINGAEFTANSWLEELFDLPFAEVEGEKVVGREGFECPEKTGFDAEFEEEEEKDNRPRI